MIVLVSSIAAVWAFALLLAVALGRAAHVADGREQRHFSELLAAPSASVARVPRASRMATRKSASCRASAPAPGTGATGTSVLRSASVQTRTMAQR
ncbi:MAG TPA: hypothetical protein VH025_08920 [Solirubrobacteraceae bacterium]|jgi:hypothetical protein|nr:hypothetical protein [Solirubrobacteraceae bacterium]